jgi:hypothetical protein
MDLRSSSVLQFLCPIGESHGLSDVLSGHLHAESLHLQTEEWGHKEAIKRHLGKMFPLGEGEMAGPS